MNNPHQSHLLHQRHRRHIGASWLLPLLLSALPGVAQAQFNCTTNNGTITITGYTGPGGAVTIPSTINGLPVTSIGASTFFMCSLTSITIPDGVTSIGDGAFDGCLSLASANIPQSVTSIGLGAFAWCSSLTSVIIPDRVTSIAALTFEDSGLTNVIIPKSVTDIGYQAFYRCASLTSVIIPSNVTSIGDQAFGSCSSLSAITVDADNSVYSSSDGVLFNKNQITLIQCPEGKAGSYTVPDSVTNFGSYAFQFCDHLTSVMMGNSLTDIGSYGCFRTRSS
jgi:hypothetical protein